MNILVWGFGNYYKQKRGNIIKDKIIAFVSSYETGTFEGFNIIKPNDIQNFKYDRLVILATAVFEIVNQLVELKYNEWDKLVLGWNIKPFLNYENILCKEGELKCNSFGQIIYKTSGFIIQINNQEELIRLSQYYARNLNLNDIGNIAIEPKSKIFGLERGIPIDRYYIEKFLDINSDYITGNVLEVAERTYTNKYGKNVDESYILHVCDFLDQNTIIANLETGEGVIDNMFDCFIITQTLPFIYDVKSAVYNMIRFLKQGGIALVTVSGITQISRFDMDRWGHYWSFTTASIKRLFEEYQNVEIVEINTFGNVKTAVYELYGLAVEDINMKDLEYIDKDYQQLITAIVKKK